MFPSLRKLGRHKGATSQKSSSQSTQGSQSASPSSSSLPPPPLPPPPPIGWSPSLGSAHTAYPLQSGLSQQGGPPQRQHQQGGFGHPQEEFFPGGFLRVEHNNITNANATSSSPTSLTRSSSVASHPKTNGFSQQAPPYAPPNMENSECYNWFVAVDQDGNGQLSPEELRSALLNDSGISFSNRTVKHLLGTFDLDGNGGIGFDEFEPLWNYIAQWRQMFTSFDGDRDGKIDASELGRALAHYNLHVGPPILNLLMNKYGISPPPNQYPGYPPRLQMEIDHFVCACILVRQMSELYDKCIGGEPGQPGQSRVSRDEFLEAVISLP